MHFAPSEEGVKRPTSPPQNSRKFQTNGKNGKQKMELPEEPQKVIARLTPGDRAEVRNRSSRSLSNVAVKKIGLVFFLIEKHKHSEIT